MKTWEKHVKATGVLGGVYMYVLGSSCRIPLKIMAQEHSNNIEKEMINKFL